jgi:hypothetical protein
MLKKTDYLLLLLLLWLKRSGEKALPEALLNAVEQWDRMDTQATMFQATV